MQKQKQFEKFASILVQFLKALKEKLDIGVKENEKKEISLLIEGGDDSLSGVNFKIYSVKPDDYYKIASNLSYMQNALGMFTISLHANSAADAGIIESLFNSFIPMIEEIPFLKPILAAGEYHFRVDDTKMSIDFIIKDQNTLKTALDLGINLKDFNDFNLCLGTAFQFGDFFNLSVDQLLERLFTVHFSMNQNFINFDSLINAMVEALNTMSQENNGMLETIATIVTYAKSFSKFIGAKFVLKYGVKEAVDYALKSPLFDDLGGKEEMAQQLESYKIMSEQLGKEMIIGFLESMGMLEAAKAINCDNLTISFTFPKYQNGVAQEINFPGLTSVFNEKFLN